MCFACLVDAHDPAFACLVDAHDPTMRLLGLDPPSVVSDADATLGVVVGGVAA